MIQLLWCTIRPQLFLNSYKEWISRSSNPSDINISVCVNNDDQKNEILNVFDNMNVFVTDKPDRIGVAYPSYYLSSRLALNEDDIVIFASDDFLPPKSWDTYIKNKLSKKQACLMVNDGYQALDFSNMAEPVFSIPIMTYSALNKMNKIIYHPEYNHLCSDAELYLNAKELNLIIDERKTDKDYIFEHFHWSNGKRNPDINDKNYYSKFEDDKKKWEHRKTLSLSERLNVNI
jgi:hypothetical protein